jgi:hypothetical protein
MAHTSEQAARHPAASGDVRREISDDIEHTLEQRSAPAGTVRARAEDRAKRGGVHLWRALKKRPSIGVLLCGGLAVAAADAVGVGELAIGLAVGYAAWQVLRKGKSVGEALTEPRRVEER